MEYGSSARVHRPLSEINVTPFVDVMLVLLVVFMVAAPMLQTGIDVNLPKTTTQNLRMWEEPLVLTVRKDGTFFLARQEVALEDLETKLRAIFETSEDRDLFLRADEAAPYGMVAKGLAAAREAGAKRLGMVTEPQS
jgi:biopolymer transport protein TolR